jgi:aminoglycoside phosphotransferase family enzyme/predicted kinase
MFLHGISAGFNFLDRRAMEQKYIIQLLKSSSYPDATLNVKLIQTHISYLFLTDRYVYKVKKPVDYGFLNFTTLDRRRFYCEEEVRLNRRLCPDVYLGVMQIRDSEQGISFQGNGEIIDYAVKMRRLPENRMLDALMRDNAVVESDIRTIAATIARFHDAAERSSEIDRYGDISVIRQNWDENFRQVAGFVGIALDRRDLDLISEWVYDFIDRNSRLFSERVAEGRIRDCDGDIHAENICLEDKVCIFDCIEFNERFRYIDTAADIAFLLMDFDYHGKKSFSDVFIDEYMSLSGDRGMSGILDFYKIYRAFVRGKVECFRLNDPDMNADEKRSACERASRHFCLARGYILRRKLNPSLVIFSGLMGTGKSTLAAELAFELGLEQVKSDAVRKQIAGIPATERCLDKFNEGIYAADYTKKTYLRMQETADSALASGHSIILDASFSKRGDRENLRQLAEKTKAGFFIINTICPDEVAKNRLDSRILDAKEPSDGRRDLFHLQKNEFEAIADDEGRLLVTDTSKPLQENMNEILRFLGLR